MVDNGVLMFIYCSVLVQTLYKNFNLKLGIGQSSTIDLDKLGLLQIKLGWVRLVVM